MATTITLTEEGRLALARTLARFMDTAFEIPGTKVRVGFDAILGLIPGLGDVIASAIGGYIVLVASQLGVPRVVLWRMLWNLGVDTAIGAIPVVGDMLDVAWKANAKNVALLERSLADPTSARRESSWAFGAIAVAMLLVGALGAGITWFLLLWLTGHAS